LQVSGGTVAAATVLRCDVPTGIITEVARLLGAFVVVLVTFVTSVDIVACPDGCATASPASRSANACPLCHGWSGFATVVSSPPALTPSIAEPLQVSHLSIPFLPSIEHPPKSA
jgi:hypothetical protein